MNDAFPWQWPVVKAALAIVLIALCGPGFAAKGGNPGPPTGGESSNNLSTPSIQTESANTVAINWSVPGAPVLGTHYSYGCAQGESYDEFKYPNTSCVDELMTPTTYYTAEQCVATGMPCEGFAAAELSRIYWQKVDVNEWWADDAGILAAVPDFAYVDFIDWGDALEAVSWNERSVIRVETQPWNSTIDAFAPEAGCTDDTLCNSGFEMWHVAGQGITEHWGVRATDSDMAVSYNYDSPFRIIKTTNARLNLTKMEAGSALCSQPGSNPGDDPPVRETWVAESAEWADTCTLSDAPFTVETSVGGKYVYGFNWRMKNVELDSLCPGWEKTGFWRLTFYVPDDEFGNHQDIVFDDATIPNVAPPALASCDRTLPIGEDCIPPAPEPVPVAAAESEDEDPDEDDRLYIPVVDSANNLSYLDICIVGKTQGGGGGKGGGGKGGGGGNH
ncbi:MAG: hypothetical protein P8X94_06520 [Woeseiaceae bacterium]